MSQLGIEEQARHAASNGQNTVLSPSAYPDAHVQQSDVRDVNQFDGPNLLKAQGRYIDALHEFSRMSPGDTDAQRYEMMTVFMAEQTQFIHEQSAILKQLNVI